jgi:superfamily II DNA or RNA helicase
MKARPSGNLEVDFGADISLTDDLMEISVLGAKVSLFLSGPAGAVTAACSECPTNSCGHVAAALSLILDEKMALGLAAPPPERVPLEMLSEEALVERAVAERRERVEADGLYVSLEPAKGVWGDYQVENPKTGRSYQVSVRGLEKGKIFCECPDFRINTLGLCKHTLAVEAYLKRTGKNLSRLKLWEPAETEIYMDYSSRPPALRVLAPESLHPEARKILRPFLDGPVTNITPLVRAIAQMERAEHEISVFPDALERIELGLHRERMEKLTSEIRRDPAGHPLRKTLLKAELLPYQLDGIAFAAGAGRAVIADEMGLGKTLQGVGLAELLAREAGVRRVLIVCPASLKSQWEDEIKKFSTRSAIRVLGNQEQRREQYSGKKFFTICNYEQVARYRDAVSQKCWDLLILDEAQRIKNYETISHKAAADINSRFLLILTGTPLENSLGELYTLVRLADQHILGPAFRFLNAHKQTDERGKLLAWRGLNEVKEALRPVFLRRTRSEVMKELPPRQTEIIKVPPTDEQAEIHNEQAKRIRRIITKPYLTEMDFLRLQKHLLLCRLAANSAALLDKDKEKRGLPGRSGKLDELWELLVRLYGEEERKMIIFSEWTGMLDLVENQLRALGAQWVRLDGKVPQARRKLLIQSFTENPAMRFFLASNAGSTGLNLQAADTVINLDLPWNPAVLEQRIGRAHRIGQTRTVQVFLLVTADTIEERLLDVLGAKSALALAALDLKSDVDFVEMTTGIDELKSRLEVLLGRAPDKPEAAPAPEGGGGRAQERRQRISEAGGRLLDAVCGFIGEILPPEPGESGAEAPAAREGAAGPEASGEGAVRSAAGAVREFIQSCVQRGEDGKARVTFTLPDENVLGRVADALAGFLKGSL